MREEMLLYYERELTYLRQLGAEFAEKYPKIASRLMLEPDRCEDPHVERLLEGFAFLASRIHLKIDDEFPEITQGLLNTLYPHYVRPVPCMTIVEMFVDPEQGKQSAGMKIPRDSVLYSRRVNNLACKFQTCYDSTIWPVTLNSAEWKTPDRLSPVIKNPDCAAVLSLQFKLLPDVKFEQLKMGAIRFYLQGEPYLVHSLYELLNNNCFEILLRNPKNRGARAIPLPPSALRPVGFEQDEGLLPYTRRSFLGYRLLQEYFAFPEKFFFLELSQLEALQEAGFDDSFEVVFQIGRFDQPERQQALEVGVSAKTIRLNCVPVANLFQQTAEPILINHQRHEYPVIADQRRQAAMEVFSIDDVVSSRPNSNEVIQYEPFYSYRHATLRDQNKTFWLASRRASNRPNDTGTDMYISLVDLSNRPLVPNVDTLTVRCTCTNRDLPSRLSFGHEQGDFEIEGFSAIKKIIALRKPTRSIPPPVGRGLLWRLISHLSLNYLSLVGDGKDALQEILKLYNFSDSSYLEKQILGIENVESEPHFARILSETGISFVRGVRVKIDFDESQFVGGGVYLFASVLERFLGLYSAMNSFSQLVVSTRQRREVMREWPPRAGDQVLL
ncbi:MAG: type VI secretion system baseplate subunit TssF [Bryobacterales bacterium]|nr:type VI secretion system baseplate subunit TssF [Bryobacterales bacterium]